MTIEQALPLLQAAVFLIQLLVMFVLREVSSEWKKYRDGQIAIVTRVALIEANLANAQAEISALRERERELEKDLNAAHGFIRELRSKN